MRLRFIIAILILLLACALQFWFASANVFIDFILSALIVFAFFFDIWEVLVFVLCAIFIVNWQPAASIDIIVFGLIPIAAFAFHKALGWKPWAGIPAAIIGGFFLLYLAIAPRGFLASGELFLMDIFGSLLFAGAIYFVFDRLNLISQ